MFQKVRLTRLSRVNVWVYTHSNIVQAHEIAVAYAITMMYVKRFT